MKKMKKTCELGCGHPVGGGGNQHKKGHCPPQARPGDNHRARKSSMRAKKKAGEIQVTRGGPIAGTGKPKGEKKKGASVKKGEEKS